MPGPQTVSMSFDEYTRGAKRLAKNLWNQVRTTPAKLESSFQYSAKGQLTGKGQGMQGVSDTVSRAAKGLKKMKGLQ